MSANLIVDLGGTCQALPSIALGAVAGSGIAYAASGGIIGQSCNLLYANTATQINIQGCPIFTSGQLRIQIQTSDVDSSGSYTDPTSGLAQLPSVLQSGGIVILNSGGLLGSIGGQVQTGGSSGQPLSGFAIQSGFNFFAFFQRPGVFARANMVSGDFYAGTLAVSLMGGLKITGSGGGFSLQPTSGAVNV